MPKKLAKNEENLWARRAGWHNLVHASQYQIHLLILNIYIFLIFRFEQCQRMEAQRLQQFKEILFGVQKCLNISEDPV